MDRQNAGTHSRAFRLALFLAAAGITFMFLKRGVPVFADEPNIAKVTFSQDGGWAATRLVRYFLLTLFYMSIIYCFHMARLKIRNTTDRLMETGLGELIRFGDKGWLLFGLSILILFSSLGYKANIIAFFLWSACFIGLVTRVRLSNLAPFITAGAVFSIFALYTIQKADGLSELLVFLYMRSTTSAAEGLIYVLSSYGVTEPFLYGEGFWFDLSYILLKLGLSPVMPFQLHELNFDALIFEKILGHNEYHMQATTSLFGQLYANFGLPATMAGAFLFFFYFVRFGDFLVNGRKTIIGTPVCFLLFQQYQTFIAGGPVLITVFDTAMSIAAFFVAYSLVYFFLRLPTGTLSFKIP
ncbi:MAG: hypothetical protein IT362_04740 [Deltaproteobacteria bacterium]|nr:hypothetical protein [Deltaproteobacteria bacterium]